MTHRTSRQALAAALIAVAVTAPAHGALPLIAGLGKQLIQDMLIDGVKSQLMGALSDSGCKGAAIASLMAGSPGRGLGSLLGNGMAPGLPAGPPAMPGTPLSGTMPGLPGTAGGVALPGAAGALGSAQMMAMLQQQLGARAGGMPAITPEQMAQIQSSMAAMQQAMAQPLSRAETLAVFDELAQLGVMTPDMQTEVRDCVTLAPPVAGDTLGMSGAILKNMVLPQLREARQQMANLTPDEREHLANEIVQALRDASPEDRQAFTEGFGVGFFPPEVVDSVKARLR